MWRVKCSCDIECMYISVALFHFISIGSSLQYNSELWSGGRGGDGE